MHRYSIDDPFRLTLPDVMSKFFCLGMSLEDAVAKTTLAPARVLGREGELGSLRPGSVGDVFVFQINRGEFSFIDTHRVERKGDKYMEPVVTVRAGALYPSGSVKRPIRPLYECDRSVFEAMGHPLERSVAMKRP
jgi:dihydroorotase